jgi:hypothetical protein
MMHGRESRTCHSSCEAGEQSGAIRCGASGAKGGDQGNARHQSMLRTLYRVQHVTRGPHAYTCLICVRTRGRSRMKVHVRICGRDEVTRVPAAMMFFRHPIVFRFRTPPTRAGLNFGSDWNLGLNFNGSKNSPTFPAQNAPVCGTFSIWEHPKIPSQVQPYRSRTDPSSGPLSPATESAPRCDLQDHIDPAARRGRGRVVSRSPSARGSSCSALRAFPDVGHELHR